MDTKMNTFLAKCVYNVFNLDLGLVAMNKRFRLPLQTKTYLTLESHRLIQEITLKLTQHCLLQFQNPIKLI